MPNLAAQAGEISRADQSAFQQIINDQIAAFNADDGLRAYSHAAPVIRQLFPTPDIFMSMVRQGYQPVYRQRSFSFGDAFDDMGSPAQEVTIVDLDGRTWTAIYSFERQANGTWKISGCRLVRIPGADV
ncbi:MAG: DUF4864 domain-containing protein [Rhizobiales bacterium]|nr:DUF4864 domain-containing protein [Hyphomicrobiales bacterium]